jgi:hypothetical protein
MVGLGPAYQLWTKKTADTYTCANFGTSLCHSTPLSIVDGDSAIHIYTHTFTYTYRDTATYTHRGASGGTGQRPTDSLGQL